MSQRKENSDTELKTRHHIGSRFKRFRENIGRVQRDLGEELGITQSTVANIERGKAYPSIVYLHYLFRQYRLNINWMLTGRGDMVIHGTSVDDKYSELINLMRVPVIEQIIFAKLEELKAILKEEIDAFYHDKADSGGG